MRFGSVSRAVRGNAGWSVPIDTPSSTVPTSNHGSLGANALTIPPNVTPARHQIITSRAPKRSASQPPGKPKAPISSSGSPESKPATVNDMPRSLMTSGSSGPIASNGARALSAASQAAARVNVCRLANRLTLGPRRKMCTSARVIWL